MLAREVTVFPKKLEVLIFYLKLINQHQIIRKAYQGSKHLNKVDNFARIQTSNIFEFSLAYAKSLFNIFDIKHLFLNRFSNFLRQLYD